MKHRKVMKLLNSFRNALSGPTAQATAAADQTEEGRRCLLHGQLAEAETLLNRALSIQPGAALPRKLLGWVAAEQGNWPQAAAHWRAVLDADLTQPELAEALQNLAEMLVALGEFDEATTLIDRLADVATGQPAALLLRARLAQRQLDEQGVKDAWCALQDRFPETARRSPGWMRLAGIRDHSEQAQFTLDDLHQAPDGESADLILSHLLPRMNRKEKQSLTRQAIEAFPDTPALHIRYNQALTRYLLSDDECREARTHARAFSERFPGHPQGWDWRLPAETDVATNDTAAVARLIEANGMKLGNHAGLDKLRAWLAAAEGDHDTAYAISQQLRRLSYIRAEDNRGLDLRPVNATPRQAFRDKILLFSAWRNEQDFAPWFLEYYRSIGVDRFFIVDNLSSDQTVQYLTAQKDVTVFSSAENFASSVSGMRWVNELIRRYGDDNWCVYVDTDEQLVVPEQETRGLRGMVDDMTARGEEVMPAFMLDTYPASMADLQQFRPGDDPLALSRLIDPEHYFFGSIECCFFQVRGGARVRLFDICDKIEKAPILRGGGGRLYQNNHNTSYARVSSRSGVLLHHKLLREALEVRKPKGNAWRIDGRLRQRRLLHELYRSSGLLETGIPPGPNAIAYENSAQLEQLGLMGSLLKNPQSLPP